MLCTILFALLCVMFGACCALSFMCVAQEVTIEKLKKKHRDEDREMKKKLDKLNGIWEGIAL